MIDVKSICKIYCSSCSYIFHFWWETSETMGMTKNDLILNVLVEFINLRYIYDFSRSTMTLLLIP